MVRTIVTPQNADLHITIPAEYIGKKLEVSFLPVDQLKAEPTPKKATMADFWGVISDETAKKLHENVQTLRNEWKRDI